MVSGGLCVSYITLAGSSGAAGGPQSVVGLQSLTRSDHYQLVPPRLCGVMHGEADNAGDMVGSMGKWVWSIETAVRNHCPPSVQTLFNVIRDVDCVCIYCIFFRSAALIMTVSLTNQVGWLNGSRLVK